MPLATQPLRDEHRELFPHVEHLRVLADTVGDASLDSLRAGIDEAYDFLIYHLIPHAEAEDRVLYPAVARLLGAPEATATMSRDHVEVGRMAADVASLRQRLGAATHVDVSLERALRLALYGLYAVVSLHFAKETEIYLPLLDAHLTADAASQLFHAMEESRPAPEVASGR